MSLLIATHISSPSIPLLYPSPPPPPPNYKQIEKTPNSANPQAQDHTFVTGAPAQPRFKLSITTPAPQPHHFPYSHPHPQRHIKGKGSFRGFNPLSLKNNYKYINNSFFSQRKRKETD